MNVFSSFFDFLKLDELEDMHHQYKRYLYMALVVLCIQLFVNQWESNPQDRARLTSVLGNPMSILQIKRALIGTFAITLGMVASDRYS